MAEASLLSVFRSTQQQALGRLSLQLRIFNSGSNVTVSQVDNDIAVNKRKSGALVKSRLSGFTLVELISVILLLGILAAMVASRITDPASFDGVVAKDGVLALSRETQQSALGRANVQVTLTPIGSDIVVSSIVSGAVSTTRSFPTNEVAITAGSVGSGTSCGSISSTITLNFDSAGEIEAFDDDGFPICLNGESSLCISPAGFAHQGACL